MKKCFILIPVMLFLFSFQLFAQYNYRVGRVWERYENGDVNWDKTIPGVTLTFTSEDGTMVKSTQTDASGSYRIDLDYARYYARVSHPGYKTYSTYPGFVVVCNDSAYCNNPTANFFLEPESFDVDLSASGILFQGALEAGSSIDIIPAITNSGSSTSGYFNIKLFVDDQEIYYQPHYGLSPGQTVSVPPVPFTPLEAGSYTVRFEVDADNHIQESDESNNSISELLCVDVPEPEPDLLPVSISCEGELRAGSAVVLKAAIQNSGTIDSGSFNVRWFIDGQEMAYTSHPPIAAGETLSFDNLNLTFVPSEAGFYTVDFEVDTDNHVFEADESNNRLSRVLQISGPAPLPDLIPVELLHNGVLEYGSEIALRVRVKNEGPGDSEPFYLTYFINGEEVLSVFHEGVSRGVTETDPAAVCYFAPERTGTYVIRAEVDAGDLLEEVDETNNSIESVLTVTAPGVDLIPVKLETEGFWEVGTEVKLKLSVKNAGPSESGMFKVQLFANEADQGSLWHKVIAPGETVTDSNVVFRFSPGVSGVYDLRYEIDSEDVINERNEANNSLVRQIYIAPPPSADLSADRMLQVALEIVTHLPASAFQKRNGAQSLVRSIETARSWLAKGNTRKVSTNIKKLLDHLNGCLMTGSPDSNDYVIDPYAQRQLQNLFFNILVVLNPSGSEESRDIFNSWMAYWVEEEGLARDAERRVRNALYDADPYLFQENAWKFFNGNDENALGEEYRLAFNRYTYASTVISVAVEVIGWIEVQLVLGNTPDFGSITSEAEEIANAKAVYDYILGAIFEEIFGP